jgi:crotonobetainyl-CoA:carnitine CoA-transferase CaiB-like acyl-CoA transferase
LFADPHLLATGGLAPITLPDGRASQTVLMPLTLDGQRPGVRSSAPRLGEHTHALLAELGYDEAAIASMQSSGVARDAAGSRREEDGDGWLAAR